MLELTATQASLAVACIVAISGFVGWLGRGPAFVLHRWWTRAPQQEQAAYLNSVADLAGKLRVNGMTIDDIRQLEQILRNPAIAGTSAAVEVVEAIKDETDNYGAFVSNVAMKARTGAAYGVADSQLEQALMDLRLMLSDHEVDALDIAQERWREYRQALETCAGLEFEGGTHAPLAGMVAGQSETERRIAEVREQVKERAGR